MNRNENKKVDMTGQKLKYKNIIIAVSLLIPIVVAILFRVKIDVTYSFDFLPKIFMLPCLNNSLTSPETFF